MTTKDVKLMIIENFIDHYTTSEEQREEMKIIANEYVNEDWVDEIAQSHTTNRYIAKVETEAIGGGDSGDIITLKNGMVIYLAYDLIGIYRDQNHLEGCDGQEDPYLALVEIKK